MCDRPQLAGPFALGLDLEHQGIARKSMLTLERQSRRALRLDDAKATQHRVRFQRLRFPLALVGSEQHRQSASESVSRRSQDQEFQFLPDRLRRCGDGNRMLIDERKLAWLHLLTENAIRVG